MKTNPGGDVVALERGSRLGSFEILGILGAGGMGDVYRARDTRLGRDVALKVLPDSLSGSPMRLARFEREARFLAALNHPAIAAIHGLEYTSGFPVLVLELVEGPTLSGRLGQRPLPLDEAIAVACQIAEALEAAHEKGIIHRDLKPSNIKLTAEGRIKLLDFGLAKACAQDKGGELDSEEESTERFFASAPGAVVGTAPYMSPEQVRGQEVDRRTDIWAFGCVLYEMLAGKRAFGGTTFADAAVEILEREPAWEALPGATPATVRRLLDRCLQKDKERRLRDIADARLELEELHGGAGAQARAPRTPAPADASEGEQAHRVSKRVATNALGLLTVVVFAVVGARWFLPAHTPPITEAAPHVLPFTSLRGREYDPAFSPDGERIAFAWDGAQANGFDIYVKQIGSEAMLRLTDDPAPDCCPTWSPDGRSVAFGRSGPRPGVFVVPALGGLERRLGDLWPWFGLSLSWSADGRRIAFSSRDSEGKPFAVYEVELSRLQRRQLTHPPAQVMGDAFPTFAPRGETLAFARMSDPAVSRIHVLLADGSTRLVSPDGFEVGGLDWARGGGALVFVSSRDGLPRLWEVGLPAGSLSLRPFARGAAPALSRGGGEAPSSLSRALRIAVSRDGKRIAYAQSRFDTNIWRISTSPASRDAAPTASRLIASTRMESGPSFSPDGRQVAFASTRSTQDDRPAIWVCGADGSECTELTSETVATGTPRFSPDGRFIAFDSGPEGRADIYLLDLDSRLTRRLTTEDSDECVPSWSSDGAFIYFASNRDGSWQVWKRSLREGDQAARVTRDGGFAAQESPDGRFLYYTKFGVPGLWRATVGGGAPTLVTRRVECWGYWAPGREGVYFLDQRFEAGPSLVFLDLQSGRTTGVGALGADAACGDAGLALSPDERWILYVQVDDHSSDLVILEGPG